MTDHLERVRQIFDEHLVVAQRTRESPLAERQPLAAVALTTDTSALTAIANDYSSADVFARQAAALAAPGDLAVGISTSGRAESVIRGVEARIQEMHIIIHAVCTPHDECMAARRGGNAA